MTVWPGVLVPEIASVDLRCDGHFCNGLPTSVLFATLVWAFTAPKRSPESKVIAGKFLAAIIRHSCSRNPVPFRFALADVYGKGVLHDATMGNWSMVCGLRL